MKKSIAAALVVAAAGVGLTALAGTAGAAEAADTAERKAWISKNTTSYVVPDNQSPRVHVLSAGTEVEPVCFSEGQQLGDSFYWFRINHDGERGFVHRDAIGGVPTDLPHCRA